MQSAGQTVMTPEYLPNRIEPHTVVGGSAQNQSKETALENPPLTKQETTSQMRPLPEALLGGGEALYQADDDLGPICFGLSLETFSFCEVPLLGKLSRRPYHLVTLVGRFNVKRLIRENRDKVYRSERRFNKSDKGFVERLLLCLGDGLFVFVANEVSLSIYAPTPHEAAKVAAQFRRYREVSPVEKRPVFRLVGISDSGPYAQDVDVETLAPVSPEELALHYGGEFLDWERSWVERLKQRRSGISVLFGPPGCGKTSYLRALMTRLLDDFVFYYLPTSCFDLLASPAFVRFWLNQTELNEGKRQIAILEDAEDLLIPRDEANRAKVSNLLNIGDGFLGEHLKLHIIATTNVPIQKLDAALLRPGRLIAVRQFRRLSRVEALRLCGAKGLALPEHEADFSLAEIYNPPQTLTSLSHHDAIGFAQPHAQTRSVQEQASAN